MTRFRIKVSYANQIFDKCKDWYLLDEDDWRTLLAECPQFADKCKEVGYEPQDLIDDTEDDCDEDGCDLEFFESEDGSGEIFVSQKI